MTLTAQTEYLGPCRPVLYYIFLQLKIDMTNHDRNTQHISEHTAMYR